MSSGRLDDDTCWALVGQGLHGVLATVHPDRGVDAVPVVYGLLAGPRIVVPVDAVKPKRRATLQRVVNVERDSRCVLLIDHYDDDWTSLWWVRVHASARPSPLTADAVSMLGDRYPQYRAPGALVSMVVLTPTAISGWAASIP